MLERLKQPRFNQAQAQGIVAVLLSAIVLGLAPTFGKQAINAGTPPLSVVALRTAFATLSLWLLFGLLPAWRRFFYIYPVGLWGCFAAGVINGLGSLMYYSGLARLDASLAQMLYTLYPIFLTLLLRLEGYAISRFTLFRLALALLAAFLLTQHGLVQTDWLGAALMVGAGLFYAAHLAVNQRVLFDVPAPTVALYTLTAMAVTVTAGYVMAGAPALPPNAGAWQAVLLLTMVTVISRISLFMGLKRLGGVQTALIGLSELLVTVLSAFVLLGEKLSALQWLGAGLLAASVLLVAREHRLGTLPTPQPWTALVLGRFTGQPEEAPLPPSPGAIPAAREPAEPERKPKPVSAPPR
jgi:drug/metabolite transporter (DMT)-like permease